MISKILHIIASMIAVVLILVGIATFFLPIPIGAILILIGLALLIGSNAAFALWLRGLRQRHPDMDSRIRRAEKWLPGPLRAPLDKTRPEDDDSA